MDLPAEGCLDGNVARELANPPTVWVDMTATSEPKNDADDAAGPGSPFTWHKNAFSDSRAWQESPRENGDEDARRFSRNIGTDFVQSSQDMPGFWRDAGGFPDSQASTQKERGFGFACMPPASPTDSLGEERLNAPARLPSPMPWGINVNASGLGGIGSAPLHRPSSAKLQGRSCTPPAPASPGIPQAPPSPTPRRGSFRSDSPTARASSSRGSATLGAPRGDVSLCVRLRPVPAGTVAEATCSVEAGSCVRLRAPVGAPLTAPRTVDAEGLYRCDLAFGPDVTQEQLYNQAVTPICDAVLRGYNGAVIAYGQTGSGKTHTMLGDARGHGQGVAPRVVAGIFAALQRLPSWRVEVSVLEIYNERVRDLLSPAPGVTHVDIHEIRADPAAVNTSFRCPDATARPAENPEEAMATLQEGVRRRETARTDMNHVSSRSHLIFTMCVSQSDKEVGATLRSRLHIVDLAGSERLKRSMASSDSGVPPVPYSTRGSVSGARLSALSPRSPRDQRREAGEINRSLSQLALVIQRLTSTPSGTSQYIPYRDAMLTRLLAESFGGSSKTCLIITCSTLLDDRDETKGSLEFGRRAKLVKNKAEINLEVQYEPSMVFKAMLAKETEELQRERHAMLAERAANEERRVEVERLLKEATAEAKRQQEQRAADVKQLEDENGELQKRLEEVLSTVQGIQETSTRELARLEEERAELRRKLQEANAEHRALTEEHAAGLSRFERENGELRRRCEAQAADVARGRQREEELNRQLDEKAAENERLDAKGSALHRRLEETARRERDQGVMVAKMEAEKISLHQQWHEAAAQAWRLLQEKAPQIVQSQPPRQRVASSRAEEVADRFEKDHVPRSPRADARADADIQWDQATHPSRSDCRLGDSVEEKDRSSRSNCWRLPHDIGNDGVSHTMRSHSRRTQDDAEKEEVPCRSRPDSARCSPEVDFRSLASPPKEDFRSNDSVERAYASRSAHRSSPEVDSRSLASPPKEDFRSTDSVERSYALKFAHRSSGRDPRDDADDCDILETELKSTTRDGRPHPRPEDDGRFPIPSGARVSSTTTDLLYSLAGMEPAPRAVCAPTAFDDANCELSGLQCSPLSSPPLDVQELESPECRRNAEQQALERQPARSGLFGSFRAAFGVPCESDGHVAEEEPRGDGRFDLR
mmetsp:Transcript_69457/g.193257  ORF Transcript_69457/g.193257 Transcript_69457/m.193257 type:complete len:1164 (+) Transcript_69457:98-3589(+)